MISSMRWAKKHTRGGPHVKPIDSMTNEPDGQTAMISIWRVDHPQHESWYKQVRLAIGVLAVKGERIDPPRLWIRYNQSWEGTYSKPVAANSRTKIRIGVDGSWLGIM